MRQTVMRSRRMLGLILLVSACGQPASHVGLVSQPTASGSTASEPTVDPAPVPTTIGGAGTTVTGTPVTPGSPSPSRPPATITPTTTTVLVRDGDGGSTVRLHVGQRLEVRLSDSSWTTPTSSADKIVVRRSSSGGYPSGRPLVAIFEAVGRGSAEVTSQTDAACFHSYPQCLMPVRQWVLHVTAT
jgi:hypothetical protein